jgi:YD repeat-containing protein
MPTRSLTVDGRTWRVVPAGRITQYDYDEFGLLFIHGTGDAREVRVTRYSPQGTRSREQSFAELTGDQLRQLFDYSQPGATSPEARYAN